ncbi:MAG TPA: MarR family transcriptional regulator [Solirubrobacter sp.]|nr:MarR family transcriptional regulator [Solirubrobacter sp.]
MSTIDELRTAFGELMGAERRLRGRDPHRPGELSIMQVRALFQLARDEEVTAGELAKRAELSPASMTAMLDQLEESGIVRRRRSESDRRQVIVTLTDRGRELLAERRKAWEERWNAELADCSEDELRASIKVMRAIAAMLESIGR